jgi:hypothetical protein
MHEDMHKHYESNLVASIVLIAAVPAFGPLFCCERE